MPLSVYFEAPSQSQNG